MKILQPIFVTCIQSVSSVHFQLSLRHLFGLLDLILGQLDSLRSVRILLLIVVVLPGGLSLLILVGLLLIIGI